MPPPPLPAGRKRTKPKDKDTGMKAAPSLTPGARGLRGKEGKKNAASAAPSVGKRQPKQTATPMKATKLNQPPKRASAKLPAAAQQKSADSAPGSSPAAKKKSGKKVGPRKGKAAKKKTPAGPPPKPLAALTGIQKMRRQVQLIRLVERMKRSAVKAAEEKLAAAAAAAAAACGSSAEPAAESTGGLATLHVGGLEGELEDEDRLQEVFEQFGDVLAVTLRYRREIKDGMAVVSWALLSYGTKTAALNAVDGIAELSKQYEGLKARELDEIQALQSKGAMGEVSTIHMEKLRELFTDSEEEEEIPQKTLKSERARIGELNYPDVTHLHVGGLEGELEDELLLQTVFGRFGTVVAVTLRYRRAVKDGKEVVSWALVSFSKPTEARKALDGTSELSKQYEGLKTRELDEMQALQSTGAMGEVTQEHMEKIRELILTCHTVCLPLQAARVVLRNLKLL
eukprot:COSAG02_NODE_12591_length_1522_cov_0.831342_1_plen_455_part_00